VARTRQPLAERLDAVAEALEHGRSRAAVEQLLAIWRQTRDPDLAELYALLIRAEARPPLAARGADEGLAAWLARLSPQARGDARLLPALLAEPPLDAADERDFVAQLGPWTPDPLLAAALGERLRFATSTPAGADARAETLAVLAEQGDPRQQPLLALLRRQPQLGAARIALRRAEAALAELAPLPLGPQTRAAAARLERRLAGQRQVERRSAELLAAVYAEPEADAPRLVYADWLTEAGDPRGEFITLQIARAGRPEQPASARETALLERHGRAWAARLDPLLGPDRAFQRGFLEAAAIEQPVVEPSVAALPEWATLTQLDGHVTELLLAHGPLAGLRQLYGFLELDRFVGLRSAGRIPGVERFEASLADPNLELDTPLGVRALLLRRVLDDRLVAMCEARALIGVEELGLYYSSALDSAAADHRERRSPRHRLELVRGRLPDHVRTLVLIDENTTRASRPRGWILSFARDPLGRFSHLRVDWDRPAHGREDRDALTQLRELLAQLDRGSIDTFELGRFDQPARADAGSLLPL
jgi:uncharacterized protein (TIGR02996 family)